jgi:hypothetical protein
MLDAQAVARLLREDGESLPLIQAETVASASLQLWSRLRDDVVSDMTRLRNRLHACPRMPGSERGRRFANSARAERICTGLSSATSFRCCTLGRPL